MTTLANATTKDEYAETLARRHYEIEPGLSRIIRLLSRKEKAPNEPVKLLEVNRNTVESGIRPLYFGARGVPYATVIVEITPKEFEAVRKGALRLPRGWKMDQQYRKPRDRG